jgi:MOSC domain-containing protein YiiM
MPEEGIFARVIRGGFARVGDPIRVDNKSAPTESGKG